MQTIQVTVGSDGRVAIPGTRPGQIFSIDVTEVAEPTEQQDLSGPIPDEEWALIEARATRLAQEIRSELPEPWLSSPHGDLLYGEDGLPKCSSTPPRSSRSPGESRMPAWDDVLG